MSPSWKRVYHQSVESNQDMNGGSPSNGNALTDTLQNITSFFSRENLQVLERKGVSVSYNTRIQTETMSQCTHIEKKAAHITTDGGIDSKEAAEKIPQTGDGEAELSRLQPDTEGRIPASHSHRKAAAAS